MHEDYEYVKSLEKEVDEHESEKAVFLNICDLLLEECVSKDVTCSYLHSLSDLNAYAELQCLYLHKVKECECLAQKLLKQTESVNKEVHNKLLKSFAKLENHSISLELALQQYKNIAISELKKLIEKCKGKSVETQFDKPSVVRQPNAQRIPKPSNLPQNRKQAEIHSNVLKPGMYRIATTTTQNREPQLPHASRNTNPHVSKSTRVNHYTSVSRPQLKSYQVKDKVVPNNSQVKFNHKEVEEHHRISNCAEFGKMCISESRNIMIKRFITSKALNHNLFPRLVNSCDADLDVLSGNLLFFERSLGKTITNCLVPQGQKASDYDNSDPVPPRQNVVPTAEKTDSSQQGLEFLFSPLLEEYYNPAHGHAEDNNNDQAPNAKLVSER
ncbi:hypothetical protein Tco_1138040 [Tanacetum coccineum]